MTLNLMLTSKAAVYLSGDFRLVSLDDQVPLPDSYDTQKLVPVIRPGWSALVAYMGIASAPPLVADMGQWIVEQMDRIPAHGEWPELATRLLQVNAWLDRLRGDRRIAFSIVGFRNRQPFMMLVSNFVDLDGWITDARHELTVHVRTPRQPEVRWVGTKRPDVFERVRLVRLLQANASRGVIPALIRESMADINASVARRSAGSISDACVSGYLLQSGAAAIGGHGIPESARCFPNWVRRDLARAGVRGFAPIAGGGAESAPIQWKGTTARVVKDSLLRIHEIANAGIPMMDGIARPGTTSSWKAGSIREGNSVLVTLTDQAE